MRIYHSFSISYNSSLASVKADPYCCSYV